MLSMPKLEVMEDLWMKTHQANPTEGMRSRQKRVETEITKQKSMLAMNLEERYTSVAAT